MNPNVENFVNQVYREVKGDFPQLTEFAIKSMILDKLRERANEQADELVACHVLTKTVEALRVLAEYA